MEVGECFAMEVRPTLYIRHVCMHRYVGKWANEQVSNHGPDKLLQARF